MNVREVPEVGQYDEVDMCDDDGFDAWLLREQEQFTAAVRESVDTDAVLQEVKRRSAEKARLEIEDRVAVAAVTGRPPSPEPDWPIDRWERVDADYVTASEALMKLSGVSEAAPLCTEVHGFVPIHPVEPRPLDRCAEVAGELFAALPQGPKGALQRIVSLVTPLTYRYFRAEASIAGMPLSVADGQARIALYSLLRELPRYDHQEQTFLRFAYGILRREVQTTRRELQATNIYALSCRHVVQWFPELPECQQVPDLRAGGRRREARLLALLGTLDGSNREIVILRVLVGLSVDEVAQATGMAPSMVLVQQSRALRALRRMLIQSE